MVFHQPNVIRLLEISEKVKKKPCKSMIARFFCCGERGIRTLDTLLRYTHFPGVLLQPLGHLSLEECKSSIFFDS